jgi:two-component sensor histidine kinase
MSADSLVISAVLIGAALGMRWRVYVLGLTSIIFALAVVMIRFASDNHTTYAIAVNVISVHVAHQIGYLFGAASLSYFLITRRGLQVLLRNMRDRNTVIADQAADRYNRPSLDGLQSSSVEPKIIEVSSQRVDRSRRPISLTTTGDLLNAVESLARAVSTEAVLDIIRNSARRLIGSDGVALILAEGDKCHYVEEDAVGPLWKGRKFRMTECISGWSMMNRRTAVIPDISTDERIPYHLYVDTFVRSLVMTPVGADRSIGALGAYWASTYQPTDYEIEIVQTLARATAAALENAALVSMLSQSLAQAELRQDELHHRAENAYLAAQSLARLSLPAGWAEVFSSRIDTLAQAHEIIDDTLARRGGIDIRELIQTELGVYGADKPDHLNIDGPSLLLDRAQAIALGVAVQELATNAMNDDTQSVLDVSWRINGNLLLFEWREDHKQEVGSNAKDDPAALRLLRRLIEDQLGGRIEQQLGDNETVCRIEFPLHEPSALPRVATLVAPSL